MSRERPFSARLHVRPRAAWIAGDRSASIHPPHPPHAVPSACAEGRRLRCDAQRETESAAYRDAILACIDERTTCADDVDGCLFEKLASASPTPAQLAVRDDFCDRCKAAGAACARDFFIT